MQLSDTSHQVLALYGEIDRQVVMARKGRTPADKAVVALVETMLPGTTGFGEAGWYQELEKFANRLRREHSDHPVEPVVFPTFAESVQHLADLPLLPTARSSNAPSEDKWRRSARPQVLFRQRNRSTERTPALAKATYAATVLEKIGRIRAAGTPAEPPAGTSLSAPLTNIGPALAGWLPSTFEAKNDSSFRAEIDTVEGRRSRSDGMATMLGQRVSEITDRASYLNVARDVVSDEFADMSLPCFGTLEDSGGLYCSTLYTDLCAEDLCVNDIARIIHPLNWPLCSEFFGEMVYCAPKYTPAHWHRIRETIGAEQDEYCLETSLIFHFTDHRTTGAGPNCPRGVVINYELDPHREDDGIVEVDNGYLWITPANSDGDPSQPGVRIRSSKQERINGLSPTATSALGCILGWGQAAESMLAGTARDVLANSALITEFQTFPTDTAKKDVDGDVDHYTPGAAPRPPLSLPPNFADTVGDVQTAVNDLIRRTASVAGDGAARWLDGLSRQDVADVTAAAGRNLTEWADLVYDTAERNVLTKDDKRTENGVVDG